jgi:protein-S-isoprenylcysteine O-methyltransferase Ste14
MVEGAQGVAQRHPPFRLLVELLVAPMSAERSASEASSMSVTPERHNRLDAGWTIRLLRSLVVGVAGLGLLLFLPAGTLDYWQAWILIAVFVLGSNAIGIYLAVYDPELLARRKQAGPTAETRPAQKIIMSVLIVAFIATLVLSALDYRFGWSNVPALVSLAGNVLAALGLYITFLVVRENTFSASNIKVFKDQKVISTGLYALVRHPMYTGTLLAMLASPPALGSWWGLLPALLAIPMLVWRILDEEKLLNAELLGYADYVRKVRYRLVPFVW